ncbi:MAG: hypothetical protein A3J47_01235 [Candidatus Yanofskybacteria bacterium RIFCSPHIGHO2_02_FULL_43_22]|uniref:GH10 domain-containing protein n=1 Tax=Candidatus Yanofskybacteria bacterium RIFCSPHIGHO2_02_FULL_43_22 TaxID=1802681 RepID=A0A1F8FJ05_9BACT|nr:MAG: hypothetical protein A3J47_01235 [Candidatus Yanofskybacteria bacterium RIFCSPHIGHO2_02_FULL_43_22]
MTKKRISVFIFLAVVASFWVLSLDMSPKTDFVYGTSFSRFHSDELKLDWKKTYLAILDDLKVRHLRLTAHWPLTEPKKGVYNFSELDFQIREAEKRNASIILAIGHRLPGWPECHTPDWVVPLSEEQHKQELLNYIEIIVNRYKNSPALQYWQIENEVFLRFFSQPACKQHNVNVTKILDEEIALVRRLDQSHPIVVTDSGEFGTWYQAYQRGDVFGTSIYLYVWWRNFLGPIRYPITPAFFRIKHSLVRLIYGTKPSMVIELSAEPWLLQPLTETSIEVQLQRMGIDKFNEMIDFSSKTGFDIFYLWGAEWWYWLSMNGHPEFWERAKELFATQKSL